MYKTKDIGLVAGLIEKGHTPRERMMEGTDVFFIFDDGDDVQEIVENYFNNRLEVDAYSFANALKAVKKSMYQVIDANKS